MSTRKLLEKRRTTTKYRRHCNGELYHTAQPGDGQCSTSKRQVSLHSRHDQHLGGQEGEGAKGRKGSSAIPMLVVQVQDKETQLATGSPMGRVGPRAWAPPGAG